MTLGGGSQSESALLAYNKRKAQLERWRGSDTEKESLEIRNRPKRVKFADKCIFQAACASNDKGQVARMIKEGYDINAVDEDGITALHQACIEDNFEMVEFLLQNGADVNISDNEGWTPLHAVATCCYVSIAKLLLEHGANVVALNNDCSIPLDICKSEEIRELFIQEINGKGIDVKDARRGEELKLLDDAKRWIASGGVDESPHPVTGATAMHVAACKGYIKVLDLLIKAGGNLNVRDFDGWTPLHAAAHWGQKEACEVLLENMADINASNNCDQTAAEIADSSVVSLLDEWKKRHDLNKNIDSKQVPQSLNNNNNSNNANNNNKNETSGVPPKKKANTSKPQQSATSEDDVTIVTSNINPHQEHKSSGSVSPSNSITVSASSEGDDKENVAGVKPKRNMEEGIERFRKKAEDLKPRAQQQPSLDVLDVDEAEDTLSELPSGAAASSESISFLPPPPPIQFVGTDNSRTTGSNYGASSSSSTVTTESDPTSASINQPLSSSSSSSDKSINVTGGVQLPQRLERRNTPVIVPPVDSESTTSSQPHQSWRRGGSLRTRTVASTAVTATVTSTTAGTEDNTSKGSSERLAVRRTRSEATAGDASLRRAYSFESDAKFYSRLKDAKERIKAIEDASARLALSSSSSITTTGSTISTSATTTTPAGPVVGYTRTTSTRHGSIHSHVVPSPASSISSTNPNPPISSSNLSSKRYNHSNLTTSSTTPANLIESSSLSTSGATTSPPDSDLFTTVVLRRNKEIDRSTRQHPNTSSRPSTSTTSTQPTNTTSSPIPHNYSEAKQTRSGLEGFAEGLLPASAASLLYTNSNSTSSLHQGFAPFSSSKATGAVSKFKNFFKSFVPPTRDEESETQRKAHAKRVRETRRSTQGVTLEELKSAEQYVKNSQSVGGGNNASGGPNSVPVSSSRREQEDANVERRPSWRLRVDDQDRNKFSLEDTRQGSSSDPSLSTPAAAPVPTARAPQGTYHSEIPYGLAQRNPSLRSKLGKGIAVDQSMLASQSANASSRGGGSLQGKPPIPPGEEYSSLQSSSQQEDDRDVKNPSGAQGAILRKKKTKRRSTGVVQFNTEATPTTEPQDSVPSDGEVGRDVSSDVEPLDSSSNRSENGVSQRINYRKLYEEVLKENQLLKSKLSRAEEDISELRLKLEKLSMTPRITTDDTEKQEKRALERKLSEMEEELKEIRHLRTENQKLRDENGALIRVISKLSK